MNDKNKKIFDELEMQESADKALDISQASRNKQEKVEWLRNAGYGLFIHWSVDSQLGCVISHSLIGASEKYIAKYYTELAQTFNPIHFDSEEIAELAKVSGFQYVVFTTKHHNGFCFWDTKTTDFNIMNTPYKTDLLKDYVHALRKYGLKVGFYYSPEDFLFLRENNLPMTRDILEPYSDDIQVKYDDLIARQCTELMSNYGPIDVIFFDGSPKEIAKKVCWDLQPDILVTRGAIHTPEQQLLGTATKESWEACVTLGSAWQYQPTNESYKSGGRVIDILVETRAKGGTLLLNIGLDAKGRIPAEQEGILREIGMWNFKNIEAIIGTRPWVITNEDNIWFLRSNSGKDVYAVITGIEDWKKGERRDFVIKSIAATDETRISVLGQSDEVVEYMPSVDARSRFEAKGDGLHISVVNAQRIYCGGIWPNPIVVKLANVSPAFIPPVIADKHDSLEQRENEGKNEVLLCAELIDLGTSEKVEMWFEYRIYPGFAFELNKSQWKKTESIEKDEKGQYICVIDNLEEGLVYQYRPVVKVNTVEIKGGINRFQTYR